MRKEGGRGKKGEGGKGLKQKNSCKSKFSLVFILSFSLVRAT